MNGLRWILSIGTGAVIGLAAAAALELSFRVMHQPATVAAVPTSRLPLDPQGWPVKAIVGFAIVFYTLVGYLHRPIAPPAPPVVAAEPAVEDSGPTTFPVGSVNLSFAPPAEWLLLPAPLLEAVRLQQAPAQSR